MEIAAPIIIASAASSVFYTKKAADIQKKQIKASNAVAQKAAELQKQQIQLTLNNEQQKNLSLLAKQQSAYKAKLGAGGLSRKGSGQVVLDTMQKEHDIEDKYLQKQADISIEALLNGIDTTRTRNLLELKQNKYETTSDTINGIGNTFSAGRKLLY
ncbi:MAG: hypothetical protein IKY98_05830 [Alphaproteobacteria bacterium]|nr:hypothetical protein [Alphaproteobacteria bacterium]